MKLKQKLTQAFQSLDMFQLLIAGSCAAIPAVLVMFVLSDAVASMWLTTAAGAGVWLVLMPFVIGNIAGLRKGHNANNETEAKFAAGEK